MQYAFLATRLKEDRRMHITTTLHYRGVLPTSAALVNLSNESQHKFMALGCSI